MDRIFFLTERHYFFISLKKRKIVFLGFVVAELRIGRRGSCRIDPDGGGMRQLGDVGRGVFTHRCRVGVGRPAFLFCFSCRRRIGTEDQDQAEALHLTSGVDSGRILVRFPMGRVGEGPTGRKGVDGC